MKIITCKTDGAEIMVDDEDFQWLSRFPWYCSGVAEHPMTFLYGKNGKGRPVYMHQLIMGGAVNTDHHDLNVLNMQKDNLRVAGHQLNGWNKGKSKACRHGKPTSQYKGISYCPLKETPRWKASEEQGAMNTNTSARQMHPMVEAIGKDEFEKCLSEMPMYWSKECGDNFKPVGMEVIWQAGEIPDCQFDIVREAMLLAFNLWKGGESRTLAAQHAIEKIRGSKVQ